MENLLQNIASGLWIVLGVYCLTKEVEQAVQRVV